MTNSNSGCAFNLVTTSSSAAVPSLLSLYLLKPNSWSAETVTVSNIGVHAATAGKGAGSTTAAGAGAGSTAGAGSAAATTGIGAGAPKRKIPPKLTNVLLTVSVLLTPVFIVSTRPPLARVHC